MEWILIGLLSITAVYPLSSALNFRSKDFKIEKLAPCPGGKDWLAYFNEITLDVPVRNKIILNGQIIVRENVGGELKLTMEVTRCNIDMSHCEQHDRLVIPKLCSKVHESNALWSPLVKGIQPRIGCPLKAGNYTLTNGTFDFSMISRLPIEGYKWMVYNKVVQLANKTENKIFCLDAEVSITSAKRKPV